MWHAMRNTYTLEISLYDLWLVNLNDYLTAFLVLDATNSMGNGELKKNLFHSMPNIWAKQVFLQGFDFEAIPFKKETNMFKHMAIME